VIADVNEIPISGWPAEDHWGGKGLFFEDGLGNYPSTKSMNRIVVNRNYQWVPEPAAWKSLVVGLLGGPLLIRRRKR